MLSDKETIKWLKKNRTDKNGFISLKGINFGSSKLEFSRIRADIINNGGQSALLGIYNNNQIAQKISNVYQEADVFISNEEQKALEIDNKGQEAPKIFN